MSDITYSKVFKTAFGSAPGTQPYAYQCRLACGSEAHPGRPESLSSGTDCRSQLIDIPTGLGKTAGVILAWLWNRVLQPDKEARKNWPRRLVYCLPMRTLVEQTHANVQTWLKRLQAIDETISEIGVHLLMGGEDAGDWDIYPEKNAILIGTQDMLLSRALNRGYGTSRAKWPMEFGLLNQDCLWTLDEVQLMDIGLATATQLQAFRRDDQIAGKQFRPCLTWWMSATLRPEWLESADTQLMVAELQKNQIGIPANERLDSLWTVSKHCCRLSIKDAKSWAKQAWQTHIESTGGEYGRVTLLIANTVRTARELHAAISALKKNDKKTTIDLRLIHSRFRGMERTAWREDFLTRSACKPETDRIIVATQVVEAGVDFSATTLFAELAPWPSLVQRFGRAARYGGTASVYVVDRNPSEKGALPYQLSELEASREALAFLPDASLAGISTFEREHGDLLPRLLPYEPTHLLLRRELEELVDTAPDLSGSDLDISRFIRSGEERDVFVFWRDFEKKPGHALKATRDELCAVAIGEAHDWLTKGSAKSKAWVWDYLDGEWRTCRKEDIYPGQTILILQVAGGYDVSVGWTGEANDKNFPLARMTIAETDRRDADADAGSDATSLRAWESIAVHGAHVAHVVNDIALELELPVPLTHLLQTGGRWHDFGKGHPAFQGCILPDAAGHPGAHDLAKAPASAWRSRRHLYTTADGDQRPGFRHELASTLALFAVLERHEPKHPALLGPHEELLAALGITLPAPETSAPPTPPEQEVLDLDQPSFDLLAYLTCAHHGKVRWAWHGTPADQDYRLRDERGLPIHGVRQEDTIPSLAMTASDGKEYQVPSLSLHMEPARIGFSARTGASWSERVAGLLQAYGPFALTYLEALLRAADIRASRSCSALPPEGE